MDYRSDIVAYESLNSGMQRITLYISQPNFCPIAEFFLYLVLPLLRSVGGGDQPSKQTNMSEASDFEIAMRMQAAEAAEADEALARELQAVYMQYAHPSVCPLCAHIGLRVFS